MLDAAFHLLPYALLAGFSPLAFAATIAVMQTGRLNALGFGAVLIVGQLLTCSLFVLVGVAATGSSHASHPEAQGLLELVLAPALIALAVRIRRTPSTVGEHANERSRSVLERLGRLRLLTALLAGLLFGVGGPKRLLLTALAATSITAAGLRDSEQAALVVWYVALATVLVWGPVILFVFLGERTLALMKRTQERLARHQRGVVVYALLLLAALLATDAVSLLWG